jgi:hypothetical protein
MKMTTTMVVQGLSLWNAWARKEYDKVGYELKAAASALECAAGWAGAEAKADAAAAVAETKALGDKLVSGATWTR